MPSNEGLGEQYYITKLRLRIVIAVEQKFISELLTSRSENSKLYGFHCLIEGG